MTQDDLAALLEVLPARDVSPRRVSRLRGRCHAALQGPVQPTKPPWTVDRAAVQRVVVPALAAAWCLAYVVEILRHAAAIWSN